MLPLIIHLVPQGLGAQVLGAQVLGAQVLGATAVFELMPRRSFIALAYAAFSLAVLALFAGAALAEQRVALVLGNSTYQNKDLALVNPRTDAKDVAAALEALGFEVLLETDAGKPATERAIEKFARMAVGADAALFYFAGHAVQHNGHNYLLPADADVTDEIGLQYQTVQVDSVRSVLAASNGIKIMVLDACRNNPVAERLAKSAVAPLALPAGERTRGLRRTEEAQGLIIAYATAPGDVALDGQGRNSPFTKAFLRRLKEPGLEIEMMFRRIAADVNAATSGRQRPETYVSLVSEYYLNRNDRIAWDKVKSTQDIGLLREFLERFPSSFYALEARYRIDALERAREDACRRDSETLAGVAPRDVARLRDLMQASACASVRKAAETRLAAGEADLAREAAACRRESADLEALARAGKAADIEALSQAAKCPAIASAAQKALREIAAKAEATCAREAELLDKIGPRDAAGLKTLLARTSCGEVKAAAAKRLDQLEVALAREAELCRREKTAFESLPAGISAREIEAFRRRANCPRTIAAVDRTLRQLAAAADAACARDNAALGKIPAHDLEALRGLAAETSCSAIRTTALERIEAEKERVAQACARDEAQFVPLAQSGDLARLESLRPGVECPRIAAAIGKKLAELKTSCAKEEASLERLTGEDAEGLHAFLARVFCEDVRNAALAKLAKLNQLLAQREETCRRESQDLAVLRARGAQARGEIAAFRPACPTLKPEIEAALASLPAPVKLNSAAQIRDAQSELRRLGCFDGRPNGKLDKKTLEGLKLYFKAKGKAGASLATIAVSDALVLELKDESSSLCAAPIIAKPEPAEEPGRPKPTPKSGGIAKLPPADTHEGTSPPKKVKKKPSVPARAETKAPRAASKPSRQSARPSAPRPIPQASGHSPGRGGISPSIGVGF